MTATATATMTVQVALPAAVGANGSQPPLMACYMAATPATGPWLAVNDGYWVVNSAWCSLTFNGVWFANMVNVPTGWTAAFVIVY